MGARDVVAGQAAVGLLDDDPVHLRGEQHGIDLLSGGGKRDDGPLGGHVPQHQRAVGPGGDEALVTRARPDGREGDALGRIGVGLHEVQLGVFFLEAHAEPAAHVALGVAHDGGDAAQDVLQRGDGLVGHVRHFRQAHLRGQLPVVEIPLLGGGHDGIAPTEADAGDLLVVVRLQGGPVLHALVVGAPDEHLGVAGYGGHALAPVDLLVGHLAQLPLGRIELHETAIAHGQLEIHELLLFVFRGEADLLQGHPAVARGQGHVFALEAAGGAADGRPREGGGGNLPGVGPVGRLEEHRAPVGQDLVEVHLVLVDAEHEGLEIRGWRSFRGGRGGGGRDHGGLGSAAGRRRSGHGNDRFQGGHGRQVHGAPGLAGGRPEERQRLAEDEDEDEEHGHDDEETTRGDEADRQAIHELDPLDAGALSRDALADADGGGGGGGSHGRLSLRLLASSAVVRLAPGRRCLRLRGLRSGDCSYSSLASSCLAISAGKGR